MLGGAAMAASLVTWGNVGSGFLMFLGGIGVTAGVIAAGIALTTRREALEQEIVDAARGRSGVDVGRQQQLDDAIDAVKRAKDEPLLPPLYRLRRAADRLSEIAGADLPVPLDARAGDLWQRCLAACLHASELARVGNGLASPSARSALREERAAVLGDIDAALDRLEAALDHVQLAAARRNYDAGDLDALSTDLDRGLAIARRVDDRMAALDSAKDVHG